DDAAGLAISENMRAQIRGLDQAWRNAQDGIALIQTADGAMSTIGDMLIRVRELVVQAANDTYTSGYSSQRQMIQQEINQIMTEINSTTHRAEYNSMRLLGCCMAGLYFPPSVGYSPPSNGDGGGSPFFISLVCPLSSFHRTIDDIIYRDDMGGYVRQETAFVTAHAHRTQSVIAYFDVLYGDIVEFSSLLFQQNPSIWILTSPCGAVFNMRELLLDTPPSSPDDIVRRYVDSQGAAVAAEFFRADRGFTFGATLFLHGVTTSGRWRMELQSFLTYDVVLAQVNRFTPLLPDGTPIFPPPSVESRGVFESRRNRELWLQLGANSNQGINVTLPNINTRILGGINGDLSRIINVVSPSGQAISQQVDYLDHALDIVNKERAKLGAVQNRLEFTARSLLISSENLQDSESRIRNADIAREMMAFVKSNFLQQAAINILAQSNQNTEWILRLLR
ncbi:MAG: flagellin, partial [Defluviitaleaceae bacterium]|nr:flagellin [Defluviitaleaceae bacterium]